MENNKAEPSWSIWKKHWKLQPWLIFGLIPESSLTGPGSPDPIYIKHHNNKNSLIFSITVALILVVVALIWVCNSFIWDINGSCSSDYKDWFAPSGAVLVLVGVFLEWRISAVINYRQTDAEGNPVTDQDLLRRWLDRFEKLSVILILAGTAIWAYGDKFVLWHLSHSF